MAKLRTVALNLLRLAGFQSITAGLQAVMPDITTLLAMAMRQPEPTPFCNLEPALEGEGLRTIQALLGHSDENIITVDTRVLNPGSADVKSPVELLRARR